jgi:ABC-type uncharacterized transport system ATPase subunit
MSIIKTIDLTKRFGDFTANDHINLSVEQQEIKCIVGENGAGKSTLMNMLYGMVAPTEGKILIHGEEVSMKSPVDAIANGIGMVHQHFKLVPSLTVFENILLGAEINKTLFKSRKSPLIDTKTEIKKVQELIEKYNFSLNPLDKIEDISVGSRQRVEILKMLYRDVEILILDEPTAVLTPQEVDELMINLKELKKQGKTIIVITHKLREVMELSDSITVIKGGKVVGSVSTKETNESELAQMMVGREVTLTSDMKRSDKKSKEIIYKVKDLVTMNDYGKPVVNQVSFQVHKGEILGIAGVEGNGQTELVKTLTGLMKSDGGTVTLGEQEVTNIWPYDLRKSGMGIIPEDRYAQGLCEDMSISDNCIAGYHDRKDVCRGGILQSKCICDKRDTFVKDYDIRIGDLDGKVSGLSGGNAQKIIVARELECNPKFLIACQPTRGVDIGSISFIHKQILNFRDKGNGVLLISSELSEVLSLSDRVLVMYKGKIVGEVNPKEVDTIRIGLMMAGINDREEEESADGK